jgi:hypothetical protein
VRADSAIPQIWLYPVPGRPGYSAGAFLLGSLLGAGYVAGKLKAVEKAAGRSIGIALAAMDLAVAQVAGTASDALTRLKATASNAAAAAMGAMMNLPALAGQHRLNAALRTGEG